jgi:hypothetical protein
MEAQSGFLFCYFRLNFELLELSEQRGVVSVCDQLDRTKQVKAEDTHQALRINRITSGDEIDIKGILLNDSVEILYVLYGSKSYIHFFHTKFIPFLGFSRKRELLILLCRIYFSKEDFQSCPTIQCCYFFGSQMQ